MGHRVAPRVGARVEIATRAGDSHGGPVAPRVGARVEINKTDFFRRARERRPSRRGASRNRRRRGAHETLPQVAPRVGA